MFALVSPEGRVTDIVEKTFPVHKNFVWIKAPKEVTNKWKYLTGEFIPPPERKHNKDYYAEATGAVMRELMNHPPFSDLPEVKKLIEHLRP